MNERKIRVQVGLMALAAIAVLGSMIVFFGTTPRWFKGGTTYLVEFPEAPGVNPGAPVRRSGIKIGQVSHVDLDEETGLVRVNIILDQPYRLRKFEVPMLSTGLLAGDASIELVAAKVVPGAAATDRGEVDPATRVEGRRSANVDALLNRASEVAPMTQDLLMDLKKSMQRLEKIAPKMEEALDEYRDLAKQANRAFPELKKDLQDVLASAKSTVKSIEEAVPGVRKQIDGLVGEYQGLAKDVRDVIPEARTMLVDALKEIKDTLKVARDIAPDVKKTIDDISAAVRQYGRLGERIDVWFQANKETITKTLDAFKTDLERLGELISPENRKQFDAIIANVRKGSDRLDEVAKQTEIALKEAGDLFRQMNGFIKALEEGASGTSTAEDSKSLKLGRRIGSVARNLDEAMDKVNRMLGDVQGLVREAGSSDGTLRRLLQDPGLAQKIDELLAQALKQIPKLDRIIRDAETFADKIARHPELLGVGGAVRPGNGLKEPPARPMTNLPGFPPVDFPPMPINP